MINIGICDDDKRCRDILKQQIINTINEKEICFTEFSNAGSMIKRKDDLDVVFLDMELPDMDGETAARQVEKEKVVIVSGYPEVFHGDWEEYASAYLEKPVNPRELKKITDRAAILKESKKMAIDKVKEYLKKYDCQIESWGPFAEGRGDMFNNPVLTEIGKKYGKTAAQTALRFLLQSNVVVIPKSTHKDRMQQNFDLFDFTLTVEDMADIEALDSGESLFFSHYDPKTVEWFMSIL